MVAENRLLSQAPPHTRHRKRPPTLVIAAPSRHSREGGNPGASERTYPLPWIPAFAGMTIVVSLQLSPATRAAGFWAHACTVTTTLSQRATTRDERADCSAEKMGTHTSGGTLSSATDGSDSRQLQLFGLPAPLRSPLAP